MPARLSKSGTFCQSVGKKQNPLTISSSERHGMMIPLKRGTWYRCPMDQGCGLNISRYSLKSGTTRP